MLSLLQVATVVIVALAWAPSFAHALELPGKLRLDEDAYRTVQRIYYPGFTIAGAAEPLSVVATAVVLAVTPAGTASFWLVLVALLAMVAVNGIFWLVVQPVNRHWMKDTQLGASGARFFGSGPEMQGEAADWTALRDRWERGHLARAMCNSVSLLALLVSIVV